MLWLCGGLFLEVHRTDVKILQCLVQFIRMWHWGAGRSLLSMIALFRLCSYRTTLLLARCWIQRSALGTEHSSRHFRLSVRRCELWPHTWMDWDAVWDGESGRARKRCIRFWWWSSKGKGQFGGGWIFASQQSNGQSCADHGNDRRSTRVWKVGSISVRTVFR